MKYLFFLPFTIVFQIYAVEPIKPIPQTVSHNPALAKIGKKLFFDPILSKDYTISCSSCHDLQMGGDDGMKTSIGINGLQGNMNAPTVFNSVFNFTQFWNGRAKDLSHQASGPLHNPVEMGMDSKMIVQRLNANQIYQKSFSTLTHRKKIVFKDVIDAIAEYEKTLITPNSKFDRFLRKEIKLSKSESNGYNHFKRLGCAVCHNGINVGGNSFQKFGAVIPMPHNLIISDRHAITKRESDKNVYKVPTLRNIALTAPYFHDGQTDTLKKAIETMAYNNLGVNITPSEINELVAFLETLTGELPSSVVKQ